MEVRIGDLYDTRFYILDLDGVFVVFNPTFVSTL